MNQLVNTLRKEILNLLISYGVLVRRIKNMPSEISRLEFTDRLIVIETLVRDLILRLTRLDDDQKGAQLLRKVSKEARKEISDQAKLDVIDKAIRNYRSVINNLKTKHRNSYIAHLREGESSDYRIPEIPRELPSAVRAAVKVVDIIEGKEINYSYKVGSMESEIDLRVALDEFK